jgi:Phasin protein
MVSADENTPVKGSGRNRRAEKAEQPARKAAKRTRKLAEPGERPEQIMEAQTLMEAAALIEALVEPMEPQPVEAAASAPSPIAPAQTAQETKPVSLQTITNAYGDYTRKSIEQTGSFIEQLAGTRSFNKAFELQNEFARQAYETFVAESRRIRALHSEMTMQRLRSLEGFVAGMKPKRSA